MQPPVKTDRFAKRNGPEWRSIHVSSLDDTEQQEPAHRDAFQLCIRELEKPQPDYQAAQVFATLSLEEAVRDVISEFGRLARTISVVSRRR
jgi:hypothetical protein